MKLEEFVEQLEEGTGSQIQHSAKQVSKSESGEMSKNLKRLDVHFGTIMDAMAKDGYGMQSLRVAVQFEDMIRMIANIYGQADDHLAIPDRRYAQ